MSELIEPSEDAIPDTAELTGGMGLTPGRVIKNAAAGDLLQAGKLVSKMMDYERRVRKCASYRYTKKFVEGYSDGYRAGQEKAFGLISDVDETLTGILLDLRNRLPEITADIVAVILEETPRESRIHNAIAKVLETYTIKSTFHIIHSRDIDVALMESISSLCSDRGWQGVLEEDATLEDGTVRLVWEQGMVNLESPGIISNIKEQAHRSFQERYGDPAQ